MEGWDDDDQSKTQTPPWRALPSDPANLRAGKIPAASAAEGGNCRRPRGARPEHDRRKLSVAMFAYTRRIMYLRGLVAGAARVDLDGNRRAR